MKEIKGYNNKGGMLLKHKIEIKDEELKRLLGNKGLIDLAYILRKDIRNMKLGKEIGIPAEQVLDEMQEIIDMAILEQSNGI